MDIKNEIRNESADYQIRTTSRDIMRRYEMEKKPEKKKVGWFFPVAGTLSFAAAACAIALICMNVSPIKPDNPPIGSAKIDTLISEVVPLDDPSRLSQTGLQLFLSGQLVQPSDSPSKKNAFRFDEDLDISINVTDKEKRIKDTYTPLFHIANDFLTTGNELSFVYGKTDYEYQGKKYQYVLKQGDNMVFTSIDLKGKDVTKTNALYSIGGEIYIGFIYVEKEEDEEKISSTFINKDKLITISKETEEDESKLVYTIGDKSGKNLLERFEISTEFPEEGSAAFEECEITHMTTRSFVKTKTEYDKDESKYQVEYSDVIYSPYSSLKTEFSFTVDGSGNLNYFF